MTRTTQQVFDSHREAIETGDFEKLIADCADDAILLTLDGGFVGKEAIAGWFGGVFKDYPNLQILFEKSAVEGDTFLLQWSAESDTVTVPRGTATFIIQDGKIQRQGEWFEMVPKEA